MNLVELNKQDGIFLTDKGSIHSYLKFYDAMFAQFKDKEINIFEVGYQYGGSCKLWEDYFPEAIIKSIDIKSWDVPSEDRAALNLLNKRIDPGKRTTFQMINMNNIDSEYFKDFKPDIAIDDGSHKLEDQIHFVKTVYPVLNDGGFLIVEDIQNWEIALPEFDKLGLHIFVVDQRKVSGVYDDIFIYFLKPDQWYFKP